MEFSIYSDIKDMVKLRNEKSRSVLKKESFKLIQLPQYEKVMAKHELISVMFKYQIMMVQKNMGNQIHLPQSDVNCTNFVSPPPDTQQVSPV